MTTSDLISRHEARAEDDDAKLDEILKKTAELTMAEKIEFLEYINDVVKENVIRIEDATQIIAVCEEAYKKEQLKYD